MKIADDKKENAINWDGDEDDITDLDSWSETTARSAQTFGATVKTETTTSSNNSTATMTMTCSQRVFKYVCCVCWIMNELEKVTKNHEEVKGKLENHEDALKEVKGILKESHQKGPNEKPQNSMPSATVFTGNPAPVVHANSLGDSFFLADNKPQGHGENPRDNSSGNGTTQLLTDSRGSSVGYFRDFFNRFAVTKGSASGNDGGGGQQVPQWVEK